MYASTTTRLDRSPLFLESWVGRLLAEEPVRAIDVGARDGFHPMFERLGGLASMLGFEPDPAAFAALAERPDHHGAFSAVHIEPLALGAGGTQAFYEFSNPNNNSLLPPNTAMTSRYAMHMFALKGAGEIETHRLDDVLFDGSKDLHGFGEFIKLDTQGSEQLILENAARMLTETTVGLISEVWFCEVYRNQPLFHDLCALLARHGLRFYGFPSFFLRSGKRLDKRRHIGRERALYADAVFIRDPLDQPQGAAGTVSRRQIALSIAFAVITGYFDFALELAETYGDEDRAQLAQAIRDLATADVAAAARDFSAVSTAVGTDADDAMLAMGRFADRWRSTFDYTDVV